MAQGTAQRLTGDRRDEVAEDLADILKDWGGIYSERDQMQMDADFDEALEAAENAALYGSAG